MQFILCSTYNSKDHISSSYKPHILCILWRCQFSPLSLDKILNWICSIYSNVTAFSKFYRLWRYKYSSYFCYFVDLEMLVHKPSTKVAFLGSQSKLLFSKLYGALVCVVARELAISFVSQSEEASLPAPRHLMYSVYMLFLNWMYRSMYFLPRR